MRVLVVASNRYRGNVASFPNGAAYKAGAAREAHHGPVDGQPRIAGGFTA